ncbi:hypothetical protein [Streptomyces sp. 061-3]|uniref:hypothetical protein n=1 Tax=Streptomyces sp. 061-3 TaxID=2789268 RepID=UPI00397EBFB6
MSDEPVRIAVEDDPSGEEAVGAGDKESALLRVEAAEELVRDRGDVVLADRRERESRGAAGVGDRDPAVDQLPPEFRGDIARVGYLYQVEGAVVRHEEEDARGVRHPRRGQDLVVRSPTSADAVSVCVVCVVCVVTLTVPGHRGAELDVMA